MKQFVVVRDQDRGAIVQPPRELGADEDLGTTLADLRRRFPPPQYEVVIGMAADLETFIRTYPRYRGRSEKETQRDQAPSA